MIFVVCSGRSGSTLLQRIFDSHPNLCAPIESKFVLHLSSKYKNTKVWDQKTIDRFCEDLYTNRKFRLFWSVDKNRLAAHFAKHRINSFQDACKAVYLSWPSIFEKREIQGIIDKNPLHARFLPALYEIFPDARFIHLTRDPRAVYCSQRNAFRKKQPYNLAWRWSLENSLILDFQRKNPKKFMTLAYEDLVAEPEIHIRKTMDFLGVPFYKTLLFGHQPLKDRIGENLYLGLPHHRNIAKPISTGHIEKWKKELSGKEIHITENISFKTAARMGYTLEGKKMLPLEKWKSNLSRFRTKFHHHFLKLLFKLPFWARKQVYGTVSLIFDKKYKTAKT